MANRDLNVRPTLALPCGIPQKMSVPQKIPTLQLDRLTTERLILIPYTIQICQNIIDGDYSVLSEMGLKNGSGWPDEDVLETLPRITDNLLRVETPTGFESWMIIKNDTLEIIGDAGFKGFNAVESAVDIGYGIIKEERRKGYAVEAVTELIRWAFTNEMVREITAGCLIDNAGSLNLLRKMNFIERKKDREMIYWSLIRS